MGRAIACLWLKNYAEERAHKSRLCNRAALFYEFAIRGPLINLADIHGGRRLCARGNERSGRDAFSSRSRERFPCRLYLTSRRFPNEQTAYKVGTQRGVVRCGVGTCRSVKAAWAAPGLALSLTATDRVYFYRHVGNMRAPQG